MRFPDPLQRPDRDGAETVAIAALAFLASRPADFERFLALTGLTPETIRGGAADPGFLAGVLDYLAGDEPLLVAFAAEAGLAPQSIVRLRYLLGGGDPE